MHPQFYKDIGQEPIYFIYNYIPNTWKITGAYLLNLSERFYPSKL